MLTKLTIRNFKKFGDVEIELGNPVVFIGPNNSGKTSALQALALWEVGLRKWLEKRKNPDGGEKNKAVTLNRRDLSAIPIPGAKLLWHKLHVRDVLRMEGKPHVHNIRIDILVEGSSEERNWKCGLEFDYTNEESLYCRPSRREELEVGETPIPGEAKEIDIAFLPPMSGLVANETRFDLGAINVRISEGRTAEVLRNLCFMLYDDEKSEKRWNELVAHIQQLFGVKLNPPTYIEERGEIEMSYLEGKILYDLSSSGRGLQQTLLLLAYLYSHPGAVLLLDEPDAHLEILRQRQIYQILCDTAEQNRSQVIIASHSEILLNEAAERDVVVAFVGIPHRINDRGSQARKALKDIRFEDYYQAEQTGWVLYLEGSTDLAILRALSHTLRHQVRGDLERPFVHYVGNDVMKAIEHFAGLRESCPNLKGLAIFDRLDRGIPTNSPLPLHCWQRKEIENYLCSITTLNAYAKDEGTSRSPGPLFATADSEIHTRAMKEAILEVEEALKKLGKPDPWSGDLKVSDEFLPGVFRLYYQKLGLYNVMDKKNFHVLARFVPKKEIIHELIQKLDAIYETAISAEVSAELSS